MIQKKKNPLAVKYDPKVSRFTDEEREALKLRSEITRERDAIYAQEDEIIFGPINNEIRVAKSSYEDVSNQLSEAKIELAEAKMDLAKFNTSPTAAPPQKEARDEVTRMMLTKLGDLKRLLQTYKGANKAEVNSLLRKLNSKTDINDLRIMLKNPDLLKEIQFLHFKLRSSMEINRNILVRNKEKGLFDFLAKMPLHSLFNPNWIPEERRKLEGIVNAQQKLVDSLTGRVGQLESLITNLEDKKNKLVTNEKREEGRHVLTGSGRSLFSKTPENKRKEESVPSNKLPPMGNKRGG